MRSNARSRTSSVSRSCASSERASAIRPDVSRSSRCTIPGPRRISAARPSRRAHARASRSRVPHRGEPRARPACRRRAGARPPTTIAGSGGAGSRRGHGSARARPPPRPRAGSSSAARYRRRARPPRSRAPPPRASRGARRGSGRAARPPLRQDTFIARRRRACDAAAAACGRRRRVPEQDRDADDDEGVREVERRPVPEVDEVGHVLSRIRSTRFERLPPISRPSAAGSTGWREPERAKKTSIQTTATAVTTVTTAVALEKSPKAMPEFWTWWIESGPRRAPTRRAERARDDVLRHLVGDHRGERDRDEAGPLPGPAASERSATETGAARSSTSHPDGRLRLGHPDAPLILDAELRPRDRAQALPPIGLPQTSQVPYVPSSIRFERGVDLARASAARPPRAPRRARGRTSPRPCPRGGCPSPPLPDLAELVLDRCRGFSSCRKPTALVSRSRSCSSSVRNSSVSVAAHSGSFPQRSPRRAAARSLRDRCLAARRSCPAKRGRKRSRRRRAAAPACRRAADDRRVRLAVLGCRATRTFQASPWRPTTHALRRPG